MPADQADAAHLAHQRMVGEPPHASQEPRRDRAHVPDDVALLVDLQRLERDRGTDRMAGIGEAMGEAAVLVC